MLCSVGAGAHAELLELSAQTFRIYADRHGYDVVLRTDREFPDLPATWEKVPLIRGLLDRYDVVFWIDSDAAIVDASRDIADELGRRDVLGLVAHHYGGDEIPNAGVMVLRTARATRRLLDELWGATEWHARLWHENSALIERLGYDHEPDEYCRLVRPTALMRRTRLLGTEWNSIQSDESPRPRINHYPGRSHRHRLAQLHADLDRLRATRIA